MGNVVRSRIARAVVRSTDVTAGDTLESLDALPGDLGVRLGLPKALARWIERDGSLIENGVEVGQPTLGLRHAFG